MRVLLCCPRCKRQLDASTVEPGGSVRCRCGQDMAVPRVRARDAVVVRCSSCGAPREEGSSACGYCGADFTARERDQNTLCPVCFARVSNASRFCSACGAAVAPEEAAESAATTDRVCPACGGENLLRSRALGGSGLTSLECERCAGLWLGEDVFKTLSERARTEEDPDPDSSRIRADAPGHATPAAPGAYRRCPVCRTMMNRRNFGRRSGILVDQCRDHGIWFDETELQEILRWIRSGGESLAVERDREEDRAAASAARFRVEPKAPDEIPFSASERDWPEDTGLVGALARLLLRRN